MKNKKKGLLHIIVILAVIALCSFTTLVGFTKAHKGSRGQANGCRIERYGNDDAETCRGT